MKISLLSVLVLLSLSQDTRAKEKKRDLIGPIRFINVQRPIVQASDPNNCFAIDLQVKAKLCLSLRYLQKGRSNIRPSGNCMWRGLEGYPSKYSYAICLL